MATGNQAAQQRKRSPARQQENRGCKQSRHSTTEYTRRSTSSESADLERPLSVSCSSTSPSREQVPRAHRRVRKTHQAQRTAPQSTTPHQTGTEQPKQSNRARPDMQKPRTSPRHHKPTHTDSEEHSTRLNRASSSNIHSRPEAQPSPQDKATQESEYADDDRDIVLTHIYKISKQVYKAFSHATHAGHRLDHYRATWSLSQLHPAAALRILNSLPHTMRTKAQQYVDHCVEDMWHAQNTQQHGNQQHYREQTPVGNSDRHKMPGHKEHEEQHQQRSTAELQKKQGRLG